MIDSKTPYSQFVRDIIEHSHTCGCRNLIFTDPPAGGDHAAVTVACGANPGVIVATIAADWDDVTREIVLE